MWVGCFENRLNFKQRCGPVSTKLKLMNFVTASQVLYLICFLLFSSPYFGAVIYVSFLTLIISGRRMRRLRAFRRRLSKSKKYMMIDRCTRLALYFICTSVAIFTP
ncbi:hypothetical protein M758_10G066300 [Ceratodon purpureus]|nr:hypothetical protein M758_10G066300 [Ceratodon purpureus]